MGFPGAAPCFGVTRPCSSPFHHQCPRIKLKPPPPKRRCEGMLSSLPPNQRRRRAPATLDTLGEVRLPCSESRYTLGMAKLWRVHSFRLLERTPYTLIYLTGRSCCSPVHTRVFLAKVSLACGIPQYTILAAI